MAGFCWSDWRRWLFRRRLREDPEKHPLKTPSGRIEIYSERLAKIAETWELPKTKGQEIHPIPRFIATAEMLGQGDPLEQKYPLEVYGYHGAGRTRPTTMYRGSVRCIPTS